MPFFLLRTGLKSPQLKMIYDKTESAMEMLGKIIYLLMQSVSMPIILAQFLFWSFFKYFRSGFSNDSFILSYPWA